MPCAGAVGHDRLAGWTPVAANTPPVASARMATDEQRCSARMASTIPGSACAINRADATFPVVTLSRPSHPLRYTTR